LVNPNNNQSKDTARLRKYPVDLALALHRIEKSEKSANTLRRQKDDDHDALLAR
jgi:hypothetical protein